MKKITLKKNTSECLNKPSQKKLSNLKSVIKDLSKSYLEEQNLKKEKQDIDLRFQNLKQKKQDAVNLIKQPKQLNTEAGLNPKRPIRNIFETPQPSKNFKIKNSKSFVLNPFEKLFSASDFEYTKRNKKRQSTIRFKIKNDTKRNNLKSQMQIKSLQQSANSSNSSVKNSPLKKGFKIKTHIKKKQKHLTHIETNDKFNFKKRNTKIKHKKLGSSSQDESQIKPPQSIQRNNSMPAQRPDEIDVKNGTQYYFLNQKYIMNPNKVQPNRIGKQITQEEMIEQFQQEDLDQQIARRIKKIDLDGSSDNLCSQQSLKLKFIKDMFEDKVSLRQLQLTKPDKLKSLIEQDERIQKIFSIYIQL